MEPPCKRQRLSGNRIPDPDLRQRRARNDTRLKSIFESIFDKYSKDFEGIGDEIDLRTGEIVVNNGHLLGIRNKTDTGPTDDPSDDAGSEVSSEEQDEKEQHGQDERTIAGDESVLSESETALQARYIVDSLVEDANVEPRPTTFGESLLGQIEDNNSGEDELADKAIEWVTPREARAIAHEKWQLPDSGPTFVDESNVEEAWRAPPLIDSTPSYRAVGQIETPSTKTSLLVDKASPSTKKILRGKHKNPGQTRSIGPDTTMLPQSEFPPNAVSTTSTPKHNGPIILWTLEEVNQLRHLKVTTNLTYKEMEPLFSRRKRTAIATKWKHLVNRGDATNDSSHRKRRRRFCPPPASRKGSSVLDRSEENNEQDHDYGQHYVDANAQSNNLWTEKLSDTVVQSINDFSHPKLASPQDINYSKTDIIDAQQNIPWPSMSVSQNEPTNLRSSSYSQRMKEDAAKRRNHLIETFDPKYFDVVPTADTSQPEEPGRPSTGEESTLDTSAEACLNRNCLTSQPSGNVSSEVLQSTHADDVDPGSVQQKRSSSQSSAEMPPQTTSSPPRNRKSASDRIRKRAVLLPSFDRRQTVQVVVPESSKSKSFQLAERRKEDLAEQIRLKSARTSGPLEHLSISTLLSEPGNGYVEFNEAARRKDKQIGIEIPDSQPATSSPAIEREQVAMYDTVAKQQMCKMLPVSPPPSSHSSRRVATSIIDDGDFNDELSIMSQSPKKQTHKSADSLIINAQSPKDVTTLTHRPRKSLSAKITKKTVADSFSSVATDLQDCSEDELSFM